MELFTGLLLQDLGDRPEARELALHVARGIADLDHLVTNLLEFTRTRTPASGVVDCCALLEDALRYTAAPAIAVERRYRNDAVLARADRDLLRPVVLNLVRNAVQAMPDGGTLVLSAAREGEHARLGVADSGPGIPTAARDEIFRPFYTTRTKGAGLGLTVARTLVTAMGGALEVESEEGRGATFTVTLPAASEEGR